VEEGGLGFVALEQAGGREGGREGGEGREGETVAIFGAEEEGAGGSVKEGGLGFVALEQARGEGGREGGREEGICD